MEVQQGSYIRKLVITGALGALTVFLGITRLGFFPWFSGASITIMHIPAIIGAILEGPYVGAGIGAIFGLFSLLQANIAPLSPFDIFFRNPLVSVLPRILFPIVVWAVYVLIARRKKMPAIILAALAGSLIHTFLVLGTLILTNGSGILTNNDATVNVWAVLGGIVVANGIPEAVAAAILATLIIAAWLGLSSGNKQSRLTRK